ncbi:hypothetical protein E4U41_001503 [Claviceps citrina]|nr:hypothetical protein E4U41_001503 [Claviceps citrina]
MEEHLDQDLDEPLLNNHLAWEDVRKNPSIQHITPLCASNSRPARRMRVAAGLAAYGKALDRFIFKPVYMTSCNDEVESLLSALWKDDPAHEFFVRSVLLKMQPEAQNSKRHARVKEVVEQVHRALDLFVGPAQREYFRAGLEVLCGRLCEGWMLIQHLQERVRPSFSFSYHGVWEPLPASPWAGRNPDKTTSASSQAATAAAASPLSATSAASQARRAETGPPRRQDVGKVIWPSFLYQHPQDECEDEELLLPGYLLTEAQTADAENEDESPRRLARRSTRNREQAGGKKRRDSGIFISTGGGLDASGAA